MEVILPFSITDQACCCILHVCGGDPTSSMGISWFCKVFSTCVEVIPKLDHVLSHMTSILHVCGGDPNKCSISWLTHLYSPRVWRWSYNCGHSWIDVHVFSTCVEVIPKNSIVYKNNKGILHVCGGDPIFTNFFLTIFGYSPRVWRWSLPDLLLDLDWSVFSTCVEVILRFRTF